MRELQSGEFVVKFFSIAGSLLPWIDGLEIVGLRVKIGVQEDESCAEFWLEMVESERSVAGAPDCPTLEEAKDFLSELSLFVDG